MAGGSIEAVRAVKLVFSAYGVGRAPPGLIEGVFEKIVELPRLCELYETAKRTNSVWCGGIYQYAGHGVGSGFGVDNFFYGGGWIAGKVFELADHEVGKSVQEDEARSEAALLWVF